MLKIIIVQVLLISTFNCLSQTPSELGKIALSVVMPESLEGLDKSHISKMETKISQILTNSGLSATGYNNNFIVYPKFEIIEKNLVEGGMQNIIQVVCEFSLFIKQADNNILFASVTKEFKGSGKNNLIAINNAITKISVSDTIFRNFVEKGKSKIIAYYESACGDITAKSETLLKMQEYEQAIGLLMTVPEGVSCYKKAQAISLDVYKAYQNKRCLSQLQEARTEFAAKNYLASLNILSQMDPSSTCFKESLALIDKAALKLDEIDKKNWDFKKKIYSDNIALEKQRIDAIRDIAVAYYKSHPSILNYTYIIK
jgi:hypothetical protein